MKTIEERANEIASGLPIEELTFLEGYTYGYNSDRDALLCEIDNLHNLTFWLRLKNHELIIGEF